MNKKALSTLFLVIFVDLLGFGIVIPILPYYASSFGGAGLAVGALMTSYSLMQFLFAPVWGSISDRVGRRPVLLWSIAATAVAQVVLGFAGSLTVLFLGRIVAGIGGANISTAYAYITDVTDEKNRAAGMGLMGAAFGLGFIFGPAIGGILSAGGNYALPMFVAAGISAFNLVLAYFVLPEPHLSAEERALRRQRRPGLADVAGVLSRPQTRVPILLFFIVQLAHTKMEASFALFFKWRWGLDALHAGYLLAAVGTIMVIFQGGLIGRLVPRFGERRLILFGAVACGVGFFAAGETMLLPVAVGGMVFSAIGYACLTPTLNALTSKGAKPSERGLVMGVNQSAASLSRVIGPIVAGLLFDSAGPSWPFYAAAFLLLIAAVFAFKKIHPATWGPVDAASLTPQP